MDSFEGLGFSKSNSLGSGKELEEQRSWRFTYEALTHVHSLRLFLFNSAVPLSWNCVSVRATIASESPISSSPVVLCQWISSEGDPCKLFVPLPVCLVDYSVPLAAFARTDHIEIKLTLFSSGGSFVDDLALLGYNYRGEPIERDGGVKADSAFSIASDAELLTSKYGVTFYCRNCSAKLTHNSISCFRALPSTDWRELADHWFGMCCCRDGVKTKSMMARFEEFTTPKSGVCLVGSTSCVIHNDDLFSNFAARPQHNISVNDEAQCTSMTENNNEIRPYDNINGQTSSKEKNEGYLLLSTDHQSCADESKPLKKSVVTTNGCSHNALEELVEPATCCSGHGTAVLGDCSNDKLTDLVVKTETLANGFMSAFPGSKLTPFLCHNCAGLVGVFSGGQEDGLQLFKCHISSDLSTGGPLDVFRFHTLERVFSSELFSNAEEDSSYRYVVRDLNSRSPLLQLVLINNESWSCSGFCLASQSTRSIAVEEVSIGSELEDGPNGTFSSQGSRLMNCPGNEKLCPLFLEPVMKVMFCDTSSYNGDQLSEVESWGLKNQSDDIFMLGGVVKALTRALQANGRLFPESCAAFQQFNLSFLAR